MELSAVFDWIWGHPVLILIAGMVLLQVYKSQRPFPEIPDSKVKKISKSEDLKDILANMESAVLIVDFYARWCPPCKAAAPVFAEWSKTYDPAQVIFAKVDVDAAKDVARQFGISAMPTFKALDRSGNELKSFVGWRRSEIQAFISEKSK